jgi:flavodoxin I
VKTIIVYGTKRGVTGRMAQKLKDALSSAGIQADDFNVSLLKASRLLDYDILLLGSSTWNDGDLQSDFVDFEREMENLDLCGKKAAVFGSGSSRYPFFCEAVQILESRLKSSGAMMIQAGLKADILLGHPEDQMQDWLDSLVSRLAAGS